MHIRLFTMYGTALGINIPKDAVILKPKYLGGTGIEVRVLGNWDMLNEIADAYVPVVLRLYGDYETVPDDLVYVDYTNVYGAMSHIFLENHQ